MSTDAIVLLREDRKEIRRLFRPIPVRDDIVAQARHRDAHPRGVDEATEEHHVAEVLCAELAAMDPDDEHFAAKTTVLIEIVTRHIKDEVQNWFPEVRKGLGRNQLQEIGAPMANLRKKAGTRKPSRAPSPNGTAASTSTSKQEVVDLLISNTTRSATSSSKSRRPGGRPARRIPAAGETAGRAQDRRGAPGQADPGGSGEDGPGRT